MIDFLSYETVALFKMNNILSWIAPFMKFYTASLNSHLTASLASLIMIIMIFFYSDVCQKRTPWIYLFMWKLVNLGFQLRFGHLNSELHDM